MNIGFVGVGRMGANMARHLADCGFHVTAVYDVNRAKATKLASELGCAASQNLSDVTAESDVIITVVSDDAAMRKIFAKSGDSLLVNARGKLFINCATITPRVHLEVEELAGKAGAAAESPGMNAGARSLGKSALLGGLLGHPSGACHGSRPGCSRWCARWCRT